MRWKIAQRKGQSLRVGKSTLSEGQSPLCDSREAAEGERGEESATARGSRGGERRGKRDRAADETDDARRQRGKMVGRERERFRKCTILNLFGVSSKKVLRKYGERKEEEMAKFRNFTISKRRPVPWERDWSSGVKKESDYFRRKPRVRASTLSLRMSLPSAALAASLAAFVFMLHIPTS